MQSTDAGPTDANGGHSSETPGWLQKIHLMLNLSRCTNRCFSVGPVQSHDKPSFDELPCYPTHLICHAAFYAMEKPLETSPTEYIREHAILDCGLSTPRSISFKVSSIAWKQLSTFHCKDVQWPPMSWMYHFCQPIARLLDADGGGTGGSREPRGVDTIYSRLNSVEKVGKAM